jgi:rubrerythrin
MFGMKRRVADLSEREILALAVSSEEEDRRIYTSYADALAAEFPATAAVFTEMAAEEGAHHDRLAALFRARFGETIPLIRRADIAGMRHRHPLWLVRPLGIAAIRRQIDAMERDSEAFYRDAAARAPDGDVKALLTDLARAESGHRDLAASLLADRLGPEAQKTETAAERRTFVLQVVQPGLAGLMDGSVSTLAPLFAAAFATRDPHDAFVVGLAAAIGAGISMGFAEALSDDGALSGRGSPLLRGIASGLMTALGGLGHTLPYLIPNFLTATIIACLVVAVELVAIAWIRARYMDTPFLKAAFQVIVGGVLVFLAGIVIGAG